MTKKLSILLFLLCYCANAEAQKDYIAEMIAIQDETQRVEYVRALSTNEIWILADQVRDRQGHWHSYGAGVILGFYFGDNWERITPRLDEFTRVIRDKQFNVEMRGALAASGFELGRRWTMKDNLQYLDSVLLLFDDPEISEADKTRIVEYSFRAFKRWVTETCPLEARVTLKPEALEVSPGILTAFVRLPQGYPVSGITFATCDGAFYERMMLSTAGGNDDETEMIIKFRRKDIEAALARIGKSIDTNFVVRGIWRGAAGTNFFEGVASIKKIIGAKSK